MLEVTAPPPAMREARRKYVRPSGFGVCPSCHASKKIGLVKSGKHLVWRIHDRTTMSKAKMTCPASGVAVCAMPGRGLDDPPCPHR